jgi:colicin import membrane protein
VGQADLGRRAVLPGEADELEELRRARQSAASKGDAAEAKRLEALLQVRDDELRRKQEQVDQLERASGDFRTRIAALERESTVLKTAMSGLQTALEKANAELGARRSQAETDAQRIDAVRKELARVREQSSSSPDRVQIARLEEEIKRREADLERKQQEIARLDQEARKSREQLARLEEMVSSPIQTLPFLFEPELGPEQVHLLAEEI